MQERRKRPQAIRVGRVHLGGFAVVGGGSLHILANMAEKPGVLQVDGGVAGEQGECFDEMSASSSSMA